MNVIVKGMDMPKNCWDCPLVNTSPCACKGYSTAIEHTRNRHPDCPLIDADALINIINQCHICYEAYLSERKEKER